MHRSGPRLSVQRWRSPPFEAAIVDTPEGRAIMARGATNQKGPQRAFLNAVEAILAVDGKLPVNLMITAEGEEELGSPNYPAIVDRYEARLRQADGVIFPMSGQDPEGQTSLILGVKGIIYWELEARGGAWGGPVAAEIHGSYKAIAWCGRSRRWSAQTATPSWCPDTTTTCARPRRRSSR